MRYIRKYENSEDRPELGDYVICDVYRKDIGQIIGIYGRAQTHVVRYENPDFITQIQGRCIVAFSKNKKDLETMATANKHNL